MVLRTLTIATVALLAALAPRAALARKNGIVAFSCDGCHTGGKPATVGLTASPDNPSLGQMVTLTITVSQTNGPVAGFYISTMPQVGTFKTITPGTQVTGTGSGVTHSAPINGGSGGVTTIQVGWSSSTPVGANFILYALSANNDGTSKGDAGGSAVLSLTSGCSGTSYYLDQDADGYGTSDPGYQVIKDCSMPVGYAPINGDCDDFTATVHPGAPEICDGKDNNCDGKIDENLGSQMFCQDKDGDGHGVPGAMMVMGCTPGSGYGDCGGDCNDNDPTIHPGAMEICDGKDNNCDGRVDEGAKVTCGVGWCRRNAVGCTAQCTPGAPNVETCNLFDDDCDGVVDNGTDLELCGAAGLKCVEGVCVDSSTVVSSGGVSGTGSGGTSGAGSGGAAGPGSGGVMGRATGGTSATGSGGAAHPATGGATNPGVGSGGTSDGAGGSAVKPPGAQGGCDVAAASSAASSARSAADRLGLALGLAGLLLARRRTCLRARRGTPTS